MCWVRWQQALSFSRIAGLDYSQNIWSWWIALLNSQEYVGFFCLKMRSAALLMYGWGYLGQISKPNRAPVSTSQYVTVQALPVPRISIVQVFAHSQKSRNIRWCILHTLYHKSIFLANFKLFTICTLQIIADYFIWISFMVRLTDFFYSDFFSPWREWSSKICTFGPYCFTRIVSFTQHPFLMVTLEFQLQSAALLCILVFGLAASWSYFPAAH
jgi:hypothetical protein